MKFLQTPEVLQRFFFFFSFPARHHNFNAWIKIYLCPEPSALQIVFLVLLFFLFLVAQKEEKGIKKKGKRERRKQNQIALESFSCKGCALLGFERFGFYYSVRRTISQKSKMTRHVVSSRWEHSKLLFQLKDPRRRPCCNPLASSWKPPAPAHHWQPKHARKPRHLSIPPPFLSHPHSSVLACGGGLGFGVFLGAHYLGAAYTYCVGDNEPLWSLSFTFCNTASTENSSASRETTPKLATQAYREPVEGWETAYQKWGRFNTILYLITKQEGWGSDFMKNRSNDVYNESALRDHEEPLD